MAASSPRDEDAPEGRRESHVLNGTVGPPVRTRFTNRLSCAPLYATAGNGYKSSDGSLGANMAREPRDRRSKQRSRNSSGTTVAGAPASARGKRPSRACPPVVGVGASAGSLGPFKEFVENVPERSGIAWVLIQHMAPDRESHLSQILGRCTRLPVAEVTVDTPVEPDRIYVVGPGQVMTLRDGTLRTVTEQDPLARRTSIDAFFLSLAGTLGARSGCALLSGAGTDGTIGLKASRRPAGSPSPRRSPPRSTTACC